MKSKKALSLVLSSILALSCLTACGDKTTDNGDANTQTSETTAAPTGPEKNTMPITTEDITLSVYTYVQAGAEQAYKSLAEHPVVIQLEKDTGLKFEFVHPPAGDDGTFFNTTIASGVLPDIMNNSFSTYPGGAEAAMEDGVLMNMNDLLDKYGYYYNEVMSSQPEESRKRIVSDSGVVIHLGSSIQPPILAGKVHYGPVLRKDIVEKYKLEMPETIEQYEAYFDACLKEGIKEPLSLPQINDGTWKTYNMFASAFGVTLNNFYLDDSGKVMYPRTQPEFKEFVQLMNSWYKKGYITSDFLSNKSNDTKTHFKSGTAGMMFDGCFSMGTINAVGKANNPEFYAVGCPYMRKNEGDEVKYADQMTSINNSGWFVTATCEHPVEAIKFIDYWYSPECHDLVVFGTGTEDMPTYTVDEKGQKHLSEFITKNPNYDYATAKAIYTINNFSPLFDEVVNEEQYLPYPEKVESWENWLINTSNNGQVSTMITPTVDEARELSSIMNPIDTYTDEQVMKFITGDQSMDKWDSFVTQINSMNVDRAIEITQDAVERYNAR